MANFVRSGLLKNGVAEGVASDSHDANYHPLISPLPAPTVHWGYAMHGGMNEETEQSVDNEVIIFIEARPIQKFWA